MPRSRTSTRAGLLLALLLLPAAALAAGGRPVLAISGLDASKPPTIRIYLTDLDSNQSPITDRKPSAYRLLVDGVPQTAPDRLQRFHQAGQPVALTLVVQVSPSLREVLTEAAEASKRLIDSLPSGSKVGLVPYTDVVQGEVKPTAPTAAKEAVDGLRVREEALEVNLPDAIKDALEGLDNPALPKNRYLVVLSDGLTLDLNFAVFSELGRRAQDKGVIVHSVGFAPLEPARLRTLHELSKRGGGTVREAKDARSVVAALNGVQEELRNQLVLYYAAPKFFDGKLHDFQIETSGGQASNIVPVELAAVVVAQDKPPWFKSTWFIVAMIAAVQLALVIIVLVAVKWRRRGAAAAVAAQQQQRRRATVEDDDEDEDEAEDREEREERADRDQRDRIDERQARVERDDREREERRPPREPTRRSRPNSSRATYESEETTEQGDEPEPGGAGRQGRPDPETASKRKLEALLQPDPSLLDSKPELDPFPARQPRINDTLSERALDDGPPAPPAPSPRELSTGPIAPRRGTPHSDGGFRLPLPDPDEFLKGQGDEPPARGGRAAPVSPAAEPMLPSPEEFLRRFAGPDAPPAKAPSVARPSAPVVGGAAASGAVAGSGIRLPSIVPEALPLDAGVQPGRFVDRKTKVMAVEDVSNLDHVAWVVDLSAPKPRTVVVRDGFTFGSDAASCDLHVPRQGVRPQHGRLAADSRGFRLVTTGERGEELGQPLQDNDHFPIGDVEFVFKLAVRNPTLPISAVRLEALDGMDVGRRAVLPEGEVVTIGAHSSNVLVVRGDGVERFHAIAVRKERLCIVSDLGTKQGLTFQEQQLGFKKLKAGEEIKLGSVRLVYTYEDWDVGEPVSYDNDEHRTWNDYR